MDAYIASYGPILTASLDGSLHSPNRKLTKSKRVSFDAVFAFHHALSDGLSGMFPPVDARGIKFTVGLEASQPYRGSTKIDNIIGPYRGCRGFQSFVDFPFQDNMEGDETQVAFS